MVDAIRRFLKAEEGTAAIEYGLLVAVVSVSVIGGSEILGQSIIELFELISDKLDPVKLLAQSLGQI